MKISNAGWVTLAVLAAGLPGFSQEPADMPEITLSVYNEAGVPEKVLAKTKREVTKIFLPEVKLTWLSCWSSRGQVATDPACSRSNGRFPSGCQNCAVVFEVWRFCVWRSLLVTRRPRNLQRRVL